MTSVTPPLAEAIKRAVSEYQAGKLAEAEQLCRQIIDASPDYFDAVHLLAVIFSRMGKNEMALATYDRALILRSDDATVHCNRGCVLQKLKRLDEALASYDRALNLQPDNANTLSTRGIILAELKRFDEALASFDRALAAEPESVFALCNRGSILQELKRFDESLASYDRVLTVRPDFAEAHFNRAISLRKMNRFDEALASNARAIAIRPNYADAHYNEALCRLLIGDFDRGWAKLEWRWKAEQLRKKARKFTQPLWLGAEDISGKTLLLHAEQGFGDSIQFCRYVPLIAARNARVILEVPNALHELMNCFTGTARIVSKGSPLPHFDMQCPLLSLPLAFKTRLETIPSTTPYLRASSEKAKNWGVLLESNPLPRIGLCWSGSPTHNNDHNRSISLRSLLPLLEAPATFVSLQKNIRPGDVKVLRERGDLLHFGDALKDFSDTAALISHLDLVISVDTSVAHLSGALAKPTWILLPYVPDWRWLLHRDDSPWYPTARLFRQDDAREWDGVIVRVRNALQDFVNSFSQERQAN